jgi:hypothetical protein
MTTTTKIGSTIVPAIGLGIMSLAHAYGPAGSDEERLDVSPLFIRYARNLKICAYV